MSLDIRENIINKIKNDNTEEIITTINESVITKDELVLPGLGVILELFWTRLSEEEKNKIAVIIKNSIHQK